MRHGGHRETTYTCKNTLRGGRRERMARTKAAETKGRETIVKGRESDMRASGQIRKIIGGILREKGEDRMYEERGAGTGRKERETNGKGNDNGSNDLHGRCDNVNHISAVFRWSSALYAK